MCTFRTKLLSEIIQIKEFCGTRRKNPKYHSLIPHVLLKTSPAKSWRKKTHERPNNPELFYKTRMISNCSRDNPGNQYSHVKIS